MGRHSGVEAPALIFALALLLPSCGRQRDAPPASDSGAKAAVAQTDTVAPAPDATEDPGSVIRAYYRAINERRYGDAYLLWASNGAASGKRPEVFRAGFDSTASVAVVLGTPGRIEGAAGSRYVDIPVRIDAVATDGGRQAFVGTYTLRKSVVDGTTPDQRAWRIHSARLRRERP